MKLHRIVFTVVFMVMLVSFSIINFWGKKSDIKADISELTKPTSVPEAKIYTSGIETVLTQNMAGGNFWNEAYGCIYNVLGKNEENGFKYVRDKNGFLYAGNFYNKSETSPKEYAKRVARLNETVHESGTKVIVLLYPTQYNTNWTKKYYGIPYTDFNQFSDEFLMWCRYYDIDYIDYKEIFEKEKTTNDGLFYKTDHHWTVPTAFEAYQILVDYMNSHYNTKFDSKYTDINNYKIENYNNMFIGSQGRDSGYSYVGLDDYELITPKFNTLYKVVSKSTNSKEEIIEGDFDKAFINRTYLSRTDYYDKDLNNCYLDGIKKYQQIKNRANPNGLKVLYYRDSYTSPLASFFSVYCRESDLLWTARTDSEELESYVKENHYDVIFVAMAVDSIVNNGLEMFKEPLEGGDISE